MSKVGPATSSQRFDGRRAITQCAVVIGEFGGVQRACGRSLDEGGHISRRVQHRVVFSLDSCFAGGASQCGSPRDQGPTGSAFRQPAKQGDGAASPKGAQRRLFGGPHHHLGAM